MGIPNAEIQDELSREVYDTDHLQLAQYVINDVEDVCSVLDAAQSAHHDPQYGEVVNSYIAKYFYKHDGQRCIKYANEIINYIDHEVDYGTKMRSIFRKPFRQLRQFWGNTYNSSNETVIPEYDERGRRNSRIARGDEREWYERCRAIG